jgi:hypothetical protein
MSLLRRLGLLLLVGLAAGGFAVYRLEQPYRGFPARPSSNSPAAPAPAASPTPW